MIDFFAQGAPAPKGSFRLGTRRKKESHRLGFEMGTARRQITVRNDSPATDAWEEAVGWAAKTAMRGRRPLVGPVIVRVLFVLERAPSSDRQLPDLAPDVDKLLRSTLDGLAKIVFANDAQVVAAPAGKVFRGVGPYAPQKAGAFITVIHADNAAHVMAVVLE